jgi:hypothetical protein
MKVSQLKIYTIQFLSLLIVILNFLFLRVVIPPPCHMMNLDPFQFYLSHIDYIVIILIIYSFLFSLFLNFFFSLCDLLTIKLRK